MEHSEIKRINKFISNYATELLASGATSARIEKNVERIAGSFRVNAEITILPSHVIITTSDIETEHTYSSVDKIKHHPISFYRNTALSQLSWQIHDDGLDLNEALRRYDVITSKGASNQWLVLLLVGFANASFCRLFGGDGWAMLSVLIATWIGYCVKIKLLEHNWDVRMVFIASAFCATIVSCSCYVYHLGSTPELAVGTSVLYLVPGIPFINSISDLIYGHNICFLSRLIQASVLTICLSIGLCLGLMVMNINV
jgi:uncharacterized membrane protein YjjP (DUF1212 family)